MHPGGQFGKHLGRAPRRFAESGSLRIFADAFQDQANTAGDLFQIDV